jgi:hypothetical protein
MGAAHGVLECGVDVDVALAVPGMARLLDAFLVLFNYSTDASLSPEAKTIFSQKTANAAGVLFSTMWPLAEAYGISLGPLDPPKIMNSYRARSTSVDKGGD